MIGIHTYLLDKGIIEENDFQKAMEIARHIKKSVEATLINNFNISKEAIGKSLSANYFCKFMAYDPNVPVAAELFQNLNRTQLIEDCWVPISWDENGIVVLADNPTNREKRKIICTAMDTRKIIYTVGIKEDIEAFINRFFDQMAITNLVLALDSGKVPADVKYAVDIILSDACREGTSGIYFEPVEDIEKTIILYQIDTENIEYLTISNFAANEIIKRIKSMANLDVKDSNLPKIGYIKFQRDALPEFRISVITQPAEDQREAVELRILPGKNSDDQCALDDLGSIN